MVSGGEFVLTDPMESDDCTLETKQPILDRLHLSSLGSPALYQQYAKDAGLEVVEYQDHSDNLVRHYARVLEETQSKRDELNQWISESYLNRMKVGLEHWIEGGRKGHLAWGCFRFRKP